MATRAREVADVLTSLDSFQAALSTMQTGLTDAQTAVTSLTAATAAAGVVIAQKANLNAYDRAAHTGTQLATTVIMANGRTVEAEMAAVRALINQPGPSAPVPNAAPSLSFPGGTADVGETATITPGTYTVATPDSVLWDVTVNGSRAMTVTTTTFTIPASAGVDPRALSVTELFNWANGQAVPGKTSTTYTVNAPPAVPVILPGTKPTMTGTGAVGQGITLNAGSYSPAASGSDAYTFKVYRNSTTGLIVYAPAAQASATASYTAVAADAGALLYLGVVPKNGSGSGVEYFSDPILIAGGAAPTYNDPTAVLPGWSPGIYEVGQTVNMDFGIPAGNASSFKWQVRRDGVDIAGQAGTATSRYQPYTFVAADQDKTLSFRVIPSNTGGGDGPEYFAPGVVVAASGTAPATGSLSGSVEVATTHNLTTLGTAGWRATPNAAGLNNKSGGISISHSAIGGTLTDSANNTGITLSYSDGVSPASSSYNTGLLALWNTAGRGCRWTIPIGTTSRTVRVYFNNYSCVMQVAASLSDGSATPITLSADSGGAGLTTRWAAVITAAAASASQTLTIDVTQVSFYGTGGDSRHMGCAST